jgi:hypothetical protein
MVQENQMNQDISQQFLPEEQSGDDEAANHSLSKFYSLAHEGSVESSRLSAGAHGFVDPVRNDGDRNMLEVTRHGVLDEMDEQEKAMDEKEKVVEAQSGHPLQMSSFVDRAGYAMKGSQEAITSRASALLQVWSKALNLSESSIFMLTLLFVFAFVMGVVVYSMFRQERRPKSTPSRKGMKNDGLISRGGHCGSSSSDAPYSTKAMKAEAMKAGIRGSLEGPGTPSGTDVETKESNVTTKGLKVLGERAGAKLIARANTIGAINTEPGASMNPIGSDDEEQRMLRAESAPAAILQYKYVPMLESDEGSTDDEGNYYSEESGDEKYDADCSRTANTITFPRRDAESKKASSKVPSPRLPAPESDPQEFSKATKAKKRVSWKEADGNALPEAPGPISEDGGQDL